MNGEDGRTELATFGTSLALAVDLRDAVAGGRPKGEPSVSLADRPETFTRTPGGYHVLTDVPGSTGEVTVAVDGGRAHLDEQWTVDLGTTDRATPETVELLPSPAYPFGGGTTLIRGIVTDASGDPVAGATVSVRGRDEVTRTTRAGEYVLPIRSIEDGDVTDGALQSGGGTPTLEAVRPESGTTATASTEVPVGETTRQDLEF